MPSARGQGAEEVVAYHALDVDLATARNTAAEAASGDWLVFLDADDELAPGYLEAMRAAEDGPAVLYPAVQYLYDGRPRGAPRIPTDRPLLELNRAVIGSAVPRDLFLEVGGFGPEPIYEDWDLWLRCSQRVPLIAVPDAVYRVHVSPRSRNLDRQLMRHWHREIASRYEGNVRLSD